MVGYEDKAADLREQLDAEPERLKEVARREKELLEAKFNSSMLWVKLTLRRLHVPDRLVYWTLARTAGADRQITGKGISGNHG